MFNCEPAPVTVIELLLAPAASPMVASPIACTVVRLEMPPEIMAHPNKSARLVLT